MVLSRFLLVAALTCFGGLAIGVSLSGQAVPQKGRIDVSSPLVARMLTGTVRSAAGRALEGVAVSAGVLDRTITTTVFTDDRGEYVFPSLPGGEYRVTAQAVGYEIGRAQLHLEPSRNIRHAFTLKNIKDFTMQLSGSEWMAALPEDTFEHRRMKIIFQNTCTGCHPPHFPLLNRFDAVGWRAVLTAMEYIATPFGDWKKDPSGMGAPIIQHFKDDLVAYLTEMRGPGPSPMKFQPDPRPKGEAARVVITEYDIPPAETPGQLTAHDGRDWSEGLPSDLLTRGLHDIAIDFNGNAWVNDAVENKNRTYAKVDIKTGQVTNFKVGGGPRGTVRASHGMGIGPDGIIWLNLYPGEATDTAIGTSVGSLGRLDPMTEKLEIFEPPKGMSGVGGHIEVDGKGKVWTVANRGALRFDPETKQFAEFAPERAPGSRFGNYGVAGDADGNGWWAVISHDQLGVGDPKSGTSAIIEMPPVREREEMVTEKDRAFYRSLGGASTFGSNLGVPWAQAPRRLSGDPTGRLVWVANWWGQNIASVDIRTRKMTFHTVPIPYSGPYKVVVDNSHVAWVTLRNTERVAKFDPQTQKWTMYMLPTLGTEARDIAVDRKTGDIWVTYDRTSKIARLQFRTEQQLRNTRVNTLPEGR